MNGLMYNMPNLLSAYRIAIIPILTFFFFVGGEVATWINVTLFFFACISDYLDGEIARSSGNTSIFGKFLDSTADKIMIGGTLMLLIAFHRITGFWVILALTIYLREILVAGLREFMGKRQIDVPISRMGKFKTLSQMFACGFLMAGDYGPDLVPYSYEIGLIGLIVATYMTVVSGWAYLKSGLVAIRQMDAENKG